MSDTAKAKRKRKKDVAASCPCAHECPMKAIACPDEGWEACGLDVAVKARFSRLAKGRNGKLASARSKTKDPQCSQAMSDWKRNGMTSAIAAILGKCRSKAHHLRRASDQRMAGREARAQSIEHKVDRGLTAKERTARAKELVAKRREGRGAATAEKPMTRDSAPSQLPPRPQRTKREAAKRHERATQLRSDRKVAQREALASRAMANAERRFGSSDAAIRQSTAEIVRDYRKGKTTYATSYSGGGYGSRVAREDVGAPIYQEVRQKSSGVVARARQLRSERAARTPSAPARVEPARPSVREQAEAHRAAKGTREERLKAIGKRMYVTSKTAQVDREKVGQAAHRLERQDPAAARRMWSESERKDRTVKRLRARMASVAEAYKPGSTDTPGAKLPRFGGAHSPAPVPSPSPPARVEPPRPSLREQADAHRKKKGEGWSRQGIVAARLYKRAKADDRASKRAQASGKYPKAVDRLKRAVARTERANAIMEKRNALITTNVIEVQPKAIREMGR